MNTKLIRILSIALPGLILAVAGFFVGRISAEIGVVLRNPGDAEVSYQAERFKALVEKVNSYVVAHDGEIPADPYRTLVESGTVNSYYDFMFGQTVVRFEVNELPPMINKDLSKNARAPFFYVDMADIGEMWTCYLDGTWERENRRGIMVLAQPSRFGQSQQQWYRAFHGAGYPYWTSIENKADWITKEKGHLQWDEARRMYVPAAETQPTRPSGT